MMLHLISPSLARTPTNHDFPILHNHRRTSSPHPTKLRSSLSDMDFPFLSPPHRSLMSDLLSSVDALSPPSPSPPFRFNNPSSTSLGAIQLLSPSDSSPVDLVLQSWIHSELPTGAAIDIASLSCFMKSTATDAPHLLLEFIQSGPASMVLIADLLPRKDLVLHPDYLHRFYESTRLEKIRRELQISPQVRPYISSSLFVRGALSPTAIAVVIECGGAAEMEEVLAGKVGPAVRELVGVWLETCVGEGTEVAAEEREVLRRRDELIKKKTIEVDLTANLPRLFGDDVARQITDLIQRAFGV